mmetsp:Transcript_75849/g.209350  ORF Transcript_75849/g.209350 Transcript_75849/m.209350 type:complete len:208 (+) Transcript_75849:1015-1638(+)
MPFCFLSAIATTSSLPSTVFLLTSATAFIACSAVARTTKPWPLHLPSSPAFASASMTSPCGANSSRNCAEVAPSVRFRTCTRTPFAVSSVGFEPGLTRPGSTGTGPTGIGTAVGAAASAASAPSAAAGAAATTGAGAASCGPPPAPSPPFGAVSGAGGSAGGATAAAGASAGAAAASAALSAGPVPAAAEDAGGTGSEAPIPSAGSV